MQSGHGHKGVRDSQPFLTSLVGETWSHPVEGSWLWELGGALQGRAWRSPGTPEREEIQGNTPFEVGWLRRNRQGLSRETWVPAS